MYNFLAHNYDDIPAYAGKVDVAHDIRLITYLPGPDSIQDIRAVDDPVDGRVYKEIWSHKGFDAGHILS